MSPHWFRLVAAGEHATTAHGALPLSYTGTIPAAGFEPATSHLQGEVAVVFTTGRVCWHAREDLPRACELWSGNKGTRPGLHPRGFEPHSPKAVSPKKYPWPITTDRVIAGWMRPEMNLGLRQHACIVGFALRGAADQLARSDDALKQPWPVPGHGCPLSELCLSSAKSGVLS